MQQTQTAILQLRKKNHLKALHQQNVVTEYVPLATLGRCLTAPLLAALNQHKAIDFIT
jgi:hypothetical protein